jgi:iron complex transport system substrate-binding protein
MESLLKWNPDYIVCRDAPYKATILADARWQDINAVKNGHVLVNPQGVFYWCVRSAEEALQILWMAKTLYPDKFADMDLVQEVKDYYETFHDYTLSDEDVNSILYPQK